MKLENRLSVCLSSQQIRQWIKDKKIISSLDESRIQPSSFEPTIGNEIFILDTETSGIFRPQTNESVYRTLLQLPKRQRERVDISTGFEIKKGFTYLVHLKEKIRLEDDEYVKSSPKSSLGRLFLNTRMLADYNPCFDEINSQYKIRSDLDLWLLIQPLAFNLILHPDVSLNQLRFFIGQDAQLTPSEIIKEFEINPLLYTKGEDSFNISTKPIITDALQIHLDLSGQGTEGIIGLRARHNPTPIDLKKKNEYEAEYFFEPLKEDKLLTIVRGEYYLLPSKEILKIPKHLNVELKSHSHIGLAGQLHFAGFIDNGFEGNLVFEIRSDELSNILLRDGMPISKLDVFKTEIPDKLYGDSIGSNYQRQFGPNPAKYFKPFDFKFAARTYKKLERLVLVQDAKMLNNHRINSEGFEFIEPEKVEGLHEKIIQGFFQSRYDCESDESILQPIPYVVLFGPNNTIFSYVRAKNIEDYGDERLFGKYSIGLGGHIIKSDAPDYINECIRREVLKEEVKLDKDFSIPKFVGTLMAYDKPVDRVHFGLVYKIHTNGNVSPSESSIISGSMVSIGKLINDPNNIKKYETWSKILIPHLSKIHKF